MTYDEEWLAIAARIAALQGPALLRAQQEQSNTEDSYGIRAMLAEECAAIVTLLQQFAKTHEATLPGSVKIAIDRFLKKRPAQSVITSPADGRAMRAAVVALPLVAGEVNHLLAGRQERLRLRSAQAFEHLQRVLAVDADVRKKWREAFAEKGEVSCEQLGAVHLLGHGIHAFKVNAAGGRTDLVFQEPIDLGKVARSSEGLVLTEWKVAKSDVDIIKAFAAARAQADIYAGGVLSGVELAGYRYLVVVTERQAPATLIPAAVESGGVIYQPINISIEPRNPSDQSKKAAQKKK